MALPVDLHHLKTNNAPVGYFYPTSAEYLPALEKFLRNGVQSHQKILYLLPHTVGSDSISGILPSIPGISDGQIEEISPFVQEIGQFPPTPEQLIAWLQDRQTAATGKGFRFSRVWLDLSNLVVDLDYSDSILEWIDTLTARSLPDLQLYCSYDRSQLPANTFLRLLSAHPNLHIENQVVANPFFGLSIRPGHEVAADVIARIDAFLLNQLNDPVPVQAKLVYQETLLAHSPYGFIAFREDGLVQSANAKALKILGYTKINELKSIPFIEFFAQDDRIQVSHLLFGDKTPGHSHPPLECRLLNCDGFPIPVEMHGTWVDLPQPYGKQLICHFNDITHHYEVEQALRANEQRYRFLVEYQGEGVIMVDENRRIDYINSAGAILVSGTPETIIGMSLQTFIPDLQIQHLQGQLKNRSKGLSASYELTVQTLNGVQRNVLVTATPRYTAEGKYNGTLAIFRDITERKQLEDRLRYQSTHDTMTSLFNRGYFDEAIENYNPKVSPPASIIIVDVDGLKEVNDQDGHKAGDRLIQKVAKILIESFRLKDIIARIGGDEFAILLYDTDEEQLHQAIIRLRRNLEEANTNLPLEQQVSFSIGGATAGLTRELSQASMDADMRMYRQKRRKKASHGSQLME